MAKTPELPEVAELPDATPLRAIGENLQRLRTSQGLSYAVLARKAGIGKSTIFNLERGQGNPAIDTLWALARALDTQIGALFVDTAIAGVQVQRRRDAPVLVDGPTRRTTGSHHSGDTSSKTFVSRHLISTRNSRQCELYWVEMRAHSAHDSAGHTPGLIEHVVPFFGEVSITVGASEPVLLFPGDRMTFPAERSHCYQTDDTEATLLSLLEYP